MRSFVVLLEIKRFEGLKQVIGYAGAARALEDVAQAVQHRLPDSRGLRVGRRQIEFELIRADAAAVELTLADLAVALARRMEIGGYTFDLAVAIGCVDSDGRAMSDELIERAEQALAQARDAGPVVMLGPPTISAAGQLTLMRDLQQAIRDDALDLHYQPKVRARTGLTHGVEALVRWPDPVRGMVPPDLFVPLAEKTGDIRALTEWVVDRAVADQAVLRRQGFEVPMHINLSGAMLADREYAWDILKRCTALQGELGFEITETAMIADPARALANLHVFADAGVRLAIDDYGSGYSSLAYLQQLPVNELKIDRMFVQRLTTAQRDPLLVRSTIDLAHSLEMEVTAEGVDSFAAMALLQVMGCDLLQGFHLSRPLPIDALLTFLRGDQARAAASSAPDPRRRLVRRGERKHA